MNIFEVIVYPCGRFVLCFYVFQLYSFLQKTGFAFYAELLKFLYINI